MLKINQSIWWNFKRCLFRMLVATSNSLFGKEILHRSLLAKWLKNRWATLVEMISPARRRQARFEQDNPDTPWFVPAAIQHIEQALRPDFRGFEWGCGRSTMWFARRVNHITSVEGRRSWFEEISRQLAANNLRDRVTLCLAEVTTEHNFIAEEVNRYAGAIDKIADGSLDFIVVDGHFRDACLQRIGQKLRPGGLLIIDNTEVIPKNLLKNISKGTTFSWNNGVWETTIIYWH